ncbi:ribonuclease P protein component 4 [Sulfuracidifex tepidarius]|uniref:ribonuclease P protein component 4 n=1 Tax=Sulfuracidifex tepidarius TaxID=1294262 RepID=UPI000A054214|nr:hypothetical protein [Sulfuracidifex tepidarius]
MAVKAKFRIYELLDMAIQEVKRGNVELGRKYVMLAVEYSRKNSLKIPIEYKRKFCRKCFTPLVLGITESRRIHSKTLIRRCNTCNWIRRYDLRRTDKKGKSITSGNKNREKRIK